MVSVCIFVCSKKIFTFCNYSFYCSYYYDYTHITTITTTITTGKSLHWWKSQTDAAEQLDIGKCVYMYVCMYVCML